MTAVGNFAVGEILTAASMNEIGAWTSYTPTVTNVGTTARVGKYYKMNKIGFLYLRITVSGAPTGAVNFSWPSGFTPSNTANNSERGLVTFIDANGDNAYGTFRNTAADIRPAFFRTIGTTPNFSLTALDLTAANQPFTMASGDIIVGIWIGEVD